MGIVTNSDGNRDEFGAVPQNNNGVQLQNREHQAPDSPQQEHKTGQPDSGHNQVRSEQEMKYSGHSNF